MINPGVITLSSKYISKTRACIEDNIGECIHFHFGNIRVDMTIKDFLNTEERLMEAAIDMIGDIWNELKEFDPVFLNYISEHILDLDKIENDTIALDDIVVYSNVYKNIKGWTYLKNSIMYKAICGDSKQYESFEQENPPLLSNAQRLKSVENMVKSNDGAVGDIVLLNRGNIILDGQHRSSCLLYFYGNRKINVKRFIFKTFDIKYKVFDKRKFILKTPIRFVKRIFRALSK